MTSAAPSLGQFEQLVLTAIVALRAEAYGVTILARVETLAARPSVTLGAISGTQDRLRSDLRAS